MFRLGFRVPVIIDMRGHIKGYMKLYYQCYPTLTGWGQYPRATVLKVCLLPNGIFMAFNYILSRFTTGFNSMLRRLN